MTPPRTGRDTTPLACRAPVNLTVDHLSSPIGGAVPRPVRAWQVPGPAPAREQAAAPGLARRAQVLRPLLTTARRGVAAATEWWAG